MFRIRVIIYKKIILDCIYIKFLDHLLINNYLLNDVLNISFFDLHKMRINVKLAKKLFGYSQARCNEIEILSP